MDAQPLPPNLRSQAGKGAGNFSLLRMDEHVAYRSTLNPEIMRDTVARGRQRRVSVYGNPLNESDARNK